MKTNIFGVQCIWAWGQVHLRYNIFGVKSIWGQTHLGSNITYPTYLIEREGRDIAQQELQNATLASEGDNLFTMLPQLVMY